jgi:competence ComEA-like helix-hairpin-helix protein
MLRSLALFAAFAAASAEVSAQVGCAKGTYFWGTFQAKHYCVKCPAGTDSAGCTNCAKDAFHKTCVATSAPKGKRTCAPGSRIDAKAASGCSPCVAGRWNGAWDSGTCHDCPKGHFMPNPGMHACYKCNVGYYADAVRSAKCTKCAACDAGTFAFTKSIGSATKAACSCLDCARGKYTAKGFSQCFDCPAGRFQGAVGSATCAICAKGQFQASKGGSTCFKCPSGFTTEEAGATSKAACSKPLKEALSCKAGTYIFYKAQTKSLYCLSCPRGQFGYIKAGWQYGGDCTKCAAGSYQPYEGRTSCFPCARGLVADKTGTACTSPTTIAPTLPTRAPTTTRAPTKPVTKSPPAHNDCVVGAWRPTTKCSKTCGSKSSEIWERKVIRQPTKNGVGCPELMLTKPCNARPCPRHCTVTSWGSYGKCDAKCGDGKKTRTRKVFTKAANGGTCPPLVDTAPCSVKTECPRDCVVTDWLSWGQCSKTCGNGTQKRMRKVQTKANDAGKKCPVLAQSRACAGYPCPIDCVVGDWSDFTTCTKTCGAGTQQRKRIMHRKPLFGGKRCPVYREERACVKACPVDCVMGAFGAWGACSRSCGQGVQDRTRVALTAARHGGVPCGRAIEQQPCETLACPVDCIMDAWTDYSPCSASCGYGTQVKTRGIARQAQAGGVGCGARQATKKCHTSHCPVHCKYSDWTPFSACSITCGKDGTQTATRTIMQSAQNGGKACEGRLVDTQTCNKGACPVHCEVSEWGEWGACSKTCYNGLSNWKWAPTQYRSRTVTAEVANGGSVCPELRESRPCNHHVLCQVNCRLGTWGGWGQCTKACGGGSQRRTREIVMKQQNNGRGCAALWEQKSCNTKTCPTNCMYGDYTAWSACSKTCGGGFATKTRGINVQGAFGGIKCDMNQLTLTKSCNMQGCPVDCVMSKWSQPKPCSATCGYGTRTQHRRIISKNENDGKACGAIVNTIACSVAECPVDCKVGAWKAWSTCTANCGGGTHYRMRPVDRFHEHGGQPCPSTFVTEACNTQFCPTDCKLAAWSEWSSCDVTCGKGVRHATRGIAVHDTNGGAKCPAANSAERKKTYKCDQGDCPRACVMTPWGDWSMCGALSRGRTCGNGSMERVRTVHLEGVASACPHSRESKPCALAPCPVDCTQTGLSGFSACTASCGGGTKTASSRITFKAQFGGKKCKPLVVVKKCNNQQCPIDAKFSGWSKWSACTVKCGGGTQSKTRRRTRSAAFGGVGGGIEEHRRCNMQMCAVDCVMGSWGGWAPCSATCGGKGSQMRYRGIERAAQHGGKCKNDNINRRVCGLKPCPIDCVMGSWTAMGECSKSCGVGTRSRERVVTTMPQNGGLQCPGHLVKSDDWRGAMEKGGEGKNAVWRNVQRYTCNAGSCPIHCEVTKYSQWSDCTKTCGGGVRTRTRKITTMGRVTGRVCPALKEEEECASKECPVDCTMTAWSSWTPCDRNCGGGEQTRTRATSVGNKYGGVPCGTPAQMRRCNTQVCAADCQLSSWGAWLPAGGCSKPCGGGFKYRTKAVKAESQGAGKACGAMLSKETVPCNQQACDIDCVQKEWSSWTPCTKSCGSGVQERSRGVQVHPVAGGKACGANLDSRKCNVARCPVDCKPAPWGNWGKCSVSCGRGTRQMTRGVAVQAANGGKTCAQQFVPLTATEPCHIKPCPVHCELSDYSEWSVCSVSCGNGFRTKTRRINKMHEWGGAPCTGRTLKATEKCDMGICPVNCVVSQWAGFGSCTRSGATVSCGGGSKTRARKVVTKANKLGAVCPHLVDTVDCAHKHCEIDCKLGMWGGFSQCDAKCGSGHATRTRAVLVKAQHGGKDCASRTEIKGCNHHACPIDCQYSYWSTWSDCSKFCGSGEQFKTRSVDVSSQGAGKTCDYDGLKQTRTCNKDGCLSNREKCARVFGTASASATKLGNGCFNALKSALVAGTTLQGAATGSCLWAFYTTMDIRERCPARVVTGAIIATEYPACERKILKVCRTEAIDCRSTNGVEIAQGKVWNAHGTRTNAAKYAPSNRSCPSPVEYSYALDAEFKKLLPRNVDINTASAKTLQNLYGIGSAYAGRIIAYRNKNGAFTSIQALARVSGISSGSVERMLSNAVVKKYMKPVVTGKTIQGDYCTFGQQVVIDWWQSKATSVHVDDSQGAALGAAKAGSLTGSVDLGKEGPWKIAFDVNSARGDAADTTAITLAGASSTVTNAKSETVSQTVTDPKVDFNFQFASSSASYGTHQQVQNAIATCMAEAKNCKPAQWGSWGECSRECNMNKNGGGLQYRKRGIAAHAQYGGKCDESFSQVRRCNNVACPWQAVVEAEDGRLAGCAAFDNDVYTSEANPRSNFKGSGYVSMDSGATKDKSCQTKASTISWQVRVPEHGRYELKFRYASDKTHTAKVAAVASEQVVINYQYEENVQFAPTGSFSNWANSAVTVDLYAGVNTIVVTTNPHARDNSKPHIDRMIVKKLKTLQRCVPGTAVPIKWFSAATPASKNLMATADGVKNGPGFDGKATGYADLGALGPWSVQFTVKGKSSTADSNVRVFLNQKNVANAAGGSDKTLAVPVSSASAQFVLDWTSMSGAVNTHQVVTDAVAVCQGCSDVKCAREQIAGQNTKSTKDDVFKIRVSHPFGKRSGSGWEASGEQHGSSHKCAWNDAWSTCQCTCADYPLGRKSCQKGEYQRSSNLLQKDGSTEVATRCLPCPEGYTSAGGSVEKCVGIAGYVWANDVHPTSQAATPAAVIGKVKK